MIDMQKFSPMKAEMLWRRFNGIRALIWLGTIPVAYFAGWVYSVAFVSICSLYANVASDIASWRSDVNPQLDKIEERLSRIEKKLDKLAE
jgi:hypothetical protein